MVTELMFLVTMSRISWKSTKP